jgi:hypothetical protein
MTMKPGDYVARILLLLVFTSSVPASPQAGRTGIAAIRTDDGYLVVWNQPDIHFMVGLKGKDVRPMGSPGTGSVAFNVDSVVFQIQSVAISEFAKNARKQKLNDAAILIAHRDWETQYLEQRAGTKLNITTVPQQLRNGSQALLWKYDKPPTRGSEQMYLTTVTGNHVVILNGVVAGKASETVVKRLLLDTIATLEVSSRPIDLPKVR